MADIVETKPSEDIAVVDARDVADVLRELSWLLFGLRLGGIRDFPRSPVPDIPPGEVSLPRIESAGEFWEAPPEPAIPETVAAPAVLEASTLASIRDDLGDCKRCRLHEGRTHLVFGEGSTTARLVFVGEGPGYDEDRQGRPFVGRAGKLLDKMIAALGRLRKDVYICNAVKCRPPNNRTPGADEIESCSPFLFRQLESIHPDVICALGLTAAQTLLGGGIPMNRLRGRTHLWRGIPVVCTYHPAYLLRTPAQKAATWQDLLAVERILRGKPNAKSV
ncbi:MAG: uracil-DNA glycosylase [Syntrophobacteraceae bacterium]